LPIVYNTSAYDSLDSLRLMDGIVDVYMPDFKVWSQPAARRYLRRPDYAEVARAAVKEMARQVGPLVVDSDGLARRGLLLRHLVMPGLLAETEAVLRFVAGELGPDTYVDLMAQYYPAGLVGKSGRDGYGEIDRHLYREEYLQAVDIGHGLGLRLDVRSVASAARAGSRRRHDLTVPSGVAGSSASGLRQRERVRISYAAVTAEPLEALYPPVVMSPDRQPHGGRPSRPGIPSTSGSGARGGAAWRRTAAAASAHDDPRLGDGPPRRPTGARPGTPAGGCSPRRAGFLTAVIDGVQRPVPVPMARWTWSSPGRHGLGRLERQVAVQEIPASLWSLRPSTV
jgi:hypothetical protein